MNIKQVCALATTSLLFAVAGPATAASMSLNHFTPHVLPVLVEVNDQGEVTSMSPAYDLRPSIRRALRKTLDKMITQPARDEDGEAISSQFVIKLATKTTPRKDGKYNLQFVYASAVHVPYGSWYWNHVDGHRLALMRQDPLFRTRRVHRDFHRYRHHYAQQQQHTMRSAQPSHQSRGHAQSARK